MTHSIRAVIGDPQAVGEFARRHFGHAPVQLTDRLHILGINDYVQDQAFPDNSDFVEPFSYLGYDLARAMAACSTVGPLVYIETDYFGGQGDQRAGVIVKQKWVPLEGGQQVGTVNQALKAIGVRRLGGMDEWDTVGLVRFRTSEVLGVPDDPDWQDQATS